MQKEYHTIKNFIINLIEVFGRYEEWFNHTLFRDDYWLEIQKKDLQKFENLS